MKLLLILLMVPMFALAGLPAPGEPGAIDDPRYCGEPARDAKGKIIRNHDELRRFMEVFPCPSDLTAEYGQCNDWGIDHTIPLKNGGCDTVANMTWLPFNLKSCAGACKDRWERKYHAHPRQQIDIRALIRKGEARKATGSKPAKGDRS
jgi:hypothetical protein